MRLKRARTGRDIGTWNLPITATGRDAGEEGSALTIREAQSIGQAAHGGGVRMPSLSPLQDADRLTGHAGSLRQLLLGQCRLLAVSAQQSAEREGGRVWCPGHAMSPRDEPAGPPLPAEEEPL
jgi:hypothetical protein